MCPESPCVWQSQSQDPGVLVPRPAVHPWPHAACNKLWQQHPPGWDSVPSTLVLHRPAPSPWGGHSLLLSQFSHLLDGGGVPETPGPSQHCLSLIFSAGSTKGLIPNSRRGNGNPEWERGRSGSTARSTVTCGPASSQVVPQPWSGLRGDEPWVSWRAESQRSGFWFQFCHRITHEHGWV